MQQSGTEWPGLRGFVRDSIVPSRRWATASPCSKPTRRLGMCWAETLILTLGVAGMHAGT